MPKEDRRIIFENEEVYKALFALATQKQLKRPPPGVITAISEDDEDPAIIKFTLNNPQDTDKGDMNVEYNRDFLAAALMLFCRGLGIPLPKSARKSVLIRDGVVMLRAQIG